MLNFSIINRFKGCGHHLNADPRGGRLAIRADKIEGGRSPVLSLSRRRLRRAKNFHRFPSRKRKVAPRRAALRHRLSVAVSPLSFPDKRAGEEKCGGGALTGGERLRGFGMRLAQNLLKGCRIRHCGQRVSEGRGVLRQSGIVCCQKGSAIDE